MPHTRSRGQHVTIIGTGIVASMSGGDPEIRNASSVGGGSDVEQTISAPDCARPEWSREESGEWSFVPEERLNPFIQAIRAGLEGFSLLGSKIGTPEGFRLTRVTPKGAGRAAKSRRSARWFRRGADGCASDCARAASAVREESG
jgi:hypothetical protein